jgi:CHASE1-domain containing sensor protein
MRTSLLQETLAQKIAGFSAAIIKFLRGQDKRSAAGRSVMVGFLRVFERRFERGRGAFVKLSRIFNTCSAAAYFCRLGVAP